MADGWGVVVMNAREEISSIHWRLQPGNLTPGFASAHFYTGPDLVVVLTLLSWDGQAMGASPTHLKSIYRWALKRSPLAIFWWHTMQDCRPDPGREETSAYVSP
jgi:hypothetical protein